MAHRHANKSTLTIYRKYKHSIKDEQNLYDNSARSNRGFVGGLMGGGGTV